MQVVLTDSDISQVTREMNLPYPVKYEVNKNRGMIGYHVGQMLIHTHPEIIQQAIEEYIATFRLNERCG